MRSRKHAVISFIFSAFMFMDGEYQGGLFLAALGAYLLFRWWNHPQRKLLEKINNDSKKFSIKVPSSYPLHLDFLKFYSKYLRLSTQYPALKNTYRELVDSMWLKLSEESTSKRWREIIKQTDSGWPSPIDVRTILNKSLEKVSIETKLMNEAMAKSH